MTYGKGLMGSHASQLTKEERWKVVYYVQHLQGKELVVEADTLMTNMIIDAEVPAMDQADDNHNEH